MRYYFDTSAAGKLLLQESETEALAAWMDSAVGDFVSGSLLETELRRIALRADRAQMEATDILDGFDLVEMTPETCRRAGTQLPKGLRSLDALHLTVAMRAADVMVTYDQRLADAAQQMGLEAVSPR